MKIVDRIEKNGEFLIFTYLTIEINDNYNEQYNIYIVRVSIHYTVISVKVITNNVEPRCIMSTDFGQND